MNKKYYTREKTYFNGINKIRVINCFDDIVVYLTQTKFDITPLVLRSTIESLDNLGYKAVEEKNRIKSHILKKQQNCCRRGSSDCTKDDYYNDDDNLFW